MKSHFVLIKLLAIRLKCQNKTSAYDILECLLETLLIGKLTQTLKCVPDELESSKTSSSVIVHQFCMSYVRCVRSSREQIWFQDVCSMLQYYIRLSVVNNHWQLCRGWLVGVKVRGWMTIFPERLVDSVYWVYHSCISPLPVQVWRRDGGSDSINSLPLIRAFSTTQSVFIRNIWLYTDLVLLLKKHDTYTALSKKASCYKYALF